MKIVCICWLKLWIFNYDARNGKYKKKCKLFCFLDRAFSIMKTKINQQNAQINSGLIYY